MSDDGRFAAAVAVVLQHEGGLVDDPADPGGITNYGISLKSYPELGRDGIANLTRDRAAAIYLADWWVRYRLWCLPDPVAGKMLDLAVNMGIGSATRCLQRALVARGCQVAVDGALGPGTFAAARSTAAPELLEALRAAAVTHYADIVTANPALGRFAAGWRNRALA